MTDVSLGDAKPQTKKERRRAIGAPLPQDTDAPLPQNTDEDSFYGEGAPEGIATSSSPNDRASYAESIRPRSVPAEEPIFQEHVHVAPTKPVNPYAPTGWQRKKRVEFDLELPSGQLCRVMRLERDDLLRMNLMEYLNTFAPMLLEGSTSDQEREDMMTKTVQEDPAALRNMLIAVDKVVMAATIKPKITEDQSLVNYGSENDWGNPDFVATVMLDDIDTFERMYIFGAAFGRSMDDLKSVWREAESVDGLADEPVVQQNTE